jgi:hypothetical protein
MTAAPSSPMDPAISQLLAAAQSLDQEPAQLLPVLAAIPDPRARRGVRHRLAVILSLAVCAVLAGAQSFTAVAEWAADADQGTWDVLGVTAVVPCESTFRRTLQHLDADALDEAAGSWAQQRTAPAAGGRRMIAVDGTTLRGSGTADDPGRHLLAALDHAHGVSLDKQPGLRQSRTDFNSFVSECEPGTLVPGASERSGIDVDMIDVPRDRQ